MAYDGTLKFDTSIDTGEFENGVKKINRLTNSSMKSISKITKAAGDTITDFGKQAKEAGDEVARGLSKDARDAVDKLGDEAKETGKEFQQEMPKVARSVESASKTIKTETGLSGKALEALGTALKKMGRLAVDGLQAVTKITAAASGAITAFGMASIKTGMDFDSGMSQIAATLGMTTADIEANIDGAGDKFQALRSRAQELGKSTSFTATEAADALNILAMSGYDAGASISMVGDVLDLAGAGSLAMGDAAKYIVGSMKGFNETGRDAKYYADLIAMGATKAATDVNSLGAALSGSAANAALYGNNAEDTTLALLRLAEANVTGEAAATALNAAFKNLYATEGQGREVLDRLGVSAYDKTTGQAKKINTIIDELTAAMAGFSDEDKIAATEAIFGIQGFNAFNKMANVSTDTMNKWREALENSDGAAERMREQMDDNLAGDMRIFNSALDGLKQKISDELTPSLRGAAKAATSMIDELTSAFEDGGFERLAEVGGEVLTRILEGVTSKAPDVVETAKKMIHSFCESLKNSENLAENGGELLLTIIDGILDSSIDLLDTALTLIEKLGKYLTENADEIADDVSEFCTKLFNLIKEHAPELASTAKTFVEKLCEKMKEHLPEPVQGFCDAFAEKVKEGLGDDSTLEDIVKIFDAISEAITGIDTEQATTVGDVLGTIVSWVIKLADENEPLHKVIHTISENLPTIISVLTEAKANWDDVWDSMAKGPEDVQANFDKMTAGFAESFPGFNSIIQNGAANAKAVYDDLAKSPDDILQNFNEFKTEIGTAWEEFKNNTTESYESIKTTASEKLEEMKTNFSETKNKIINTVVTWGSEMKLKAASAARETVDRVIQFISELPRKLQTKLNEAIQNLVSFKNDFAQKGSEAATEFVTNILNGLANLPNQLWTVGSNIVTGVWNGINSNSGWFSNSVSGFFGGIVGSVKRRLGIHSPSTVFEDEVGVNIPAGTKRGIQKGMPALLKATKDQMQQLVEVARAGITADLGSITGGVAEAVSGARADRLQYVTVGGTLTSDRPQEIHTTLTLDGRVLAEQITPAVNHELYRIDKRNNGRGRGDA